MKSISTATLILLMVLGFWGISVVFATDNTEQMILLRPDVNINATVHAVRLQKRQDELEAGSRERLASYATQLEQAQSRLDDLKVISQSQVAQQDTQLARLQQMVEAKQALIQTLEADIIRLKQELLEDDRTHQAQSSAAQTAIDLAEQQLQQRVQGISAQLKAAQEQLAGQPTAVPLVDNTNKPNTWSARDRSKSGSIADEPDDNDEPEVEYDEDEDEEEDGRSHEKEEEDDEEDGKNYEKDEDDERGENHDKSDDD